MPRLFTESPASSCTPASQHARTWAPAHDQFTRERDCSAVKYEYCQARAPAANGVAQRINNQTGLVDCRIQRLARPTSGPHASSMDSSCSGATNMYAAWPPSAPRRAASAGRPPGRTPRPLPFTLSNAAACRRRQGSDAHSAHPQVPHRGTLGPTTSIACKCTIRAGNAGACRLLSATSDIDTLIAVPFSSTPSCC